MDRNVADVRSWVEENDAHLLRSASFEIEELRDSGNGIPGSYAIKGLASVYNKWSLNLGGFRERILPHAFDRVLSEEPHVLHTWDHDTARTLSSTKSKVYPLELKSVKEGLQFYSRVAPTDDARNLRVLMEGDVINQSSFAFTVREAEWRFIEDEDILERDVKEVDGLFDVTTCAMGAYPQTESEIAVRSLLKGAKRANGFFFPGSMNATVTSAAGTFSTSDFGTRASGADGNADQPAEEPAEQGAPAAEQAAQEEGQAPPAQHPEPREPEPAPEDREAKEREHKLWQRKRAAEHRRTREFAFGVTPQQEKEQ